MPLCGKLSENRKGGAIAIKITSQDVERFANRLRERERSAATVEKYTREARVLLAALEDGELTKLGLIAYKESLSGCGRYSVSTVNGKLTAINAFLKFLKRPQWELSRIRVQEAPFREEKRNLSKEEFRRLTEAARRSRNTRRLLLLQTLAATGIRVSELRCITVEAIRSGIAEVRLKGKHRRVVIPKELARVLLEYAKEQGIRSGAIFRTRTGRPMARQQVWAELKKLCAAAGVDRDKVFPHNLRHLFACCLYQRTKDMAGVADVLGHSSVETTRIYLRRTLESFRKDIDSLGLVL